ncbi:MAG: restriction endonuclease [Methylococcus sp.]
MKKPETSRTFNLAIKLIYAALTILKERGGEAPSREVMEAVGNRVLLDEWALQTYEKTGYIRWKSTLSFYTIDCIKAGYLVKKKGVWYLTPEGEAALMLGDEALLRSAVAAYRKWKAENQPSTENIGDDTETVETDETVITIDQYEQAAIEGLKRHIDVKNGYEFQDLVAALLRGMGYYTPFVAPKGKDGGIDVLAYRDPLGTITPRIKVQCKHKEATATAQEIRQLMGLLQKDGDVGLFISSSGFTADARATARSSHVHVELIDLDRLISLWQEFYQKLSDEDKNQLPMTPIYFFAPPI